MADILRGLKAGAVAGCITAVALSIIASSYHFNILLAFPLFGFLGLFFGGLFATLYEKLPTVNSLSKGLIFSLPGGIVYTFVAVLLSWEKPPLSYIMNVFAFAEVIFAIYGLLLGFFYDRFGPKKAGSKKK